MARENLTNFASTTLSGTITSGAMSFAVATTGGAAFPTVSTSNPRYFVVSIDSELILCSQRSSDTFTVSQRGYEGTTPAGHSNGAPVTLAITAGMVNHIWSALPDTFNLDVPPYARGGSVPSQWDDEFESSSGLWTFYPVNSGASGDYGTTNPSCFTFTRADFNNTDYFLYQPFAPGAGSWQVTAKLSHGARQAGYGGSAVPSIEASLFVADLANPTGGSDVGNQVRIDHGFHASLFNVASISGYSNVSTTVPLFKASKVDSGTYSALAWTTSAGERYMRLAYNGNGLYLFWIGDGYVWRAIASLSKTITPASLGFRFHVGNASSARLSNIALVDWVRVDQGIVFG